MPFASISTVFASAGLASPERFAALQKAWRITVENGSQDGLLTFVARENGLTEEALLQRLSTILGWPFVDLPHLSVPPRPARESPPKSPSSIWCCPPPSRTMSCRWPSAIRSTPPCSTPCASTLAGPVEFALAPRIEIEKALKKYYGVGAETLDEIAEDEPLELLVGEDKEITESDQEASVIKFVNQIIWEAFKDRATDIHFEPAEDELRIRYRIDGILHQTPMPPQLKRFQAAIISRIKVMSGMNIAEKRLPQDGRINVRIKGEEIDIRVSTVPTVYGESVSLRLLTRGKIFLTPGQARLRARGRARPSARSSSSRTASCWSPAPPVPGKSTSLYAFLSTINSVHKRIITIEEPVEYELKGINQIAVRPEIGLTFAMGLRHILRQDPNVIMVGEIRDLETAEIAIRAALTGHLVFSTLHTNDAPSAFTRLIDMGIEPFLVASSVEAVMAQRLVRTICPHCKAEQKVERDYLGKIGFPRDEIATARFYHGVGCEECRQLGYQGRMGIYELLMLIRGACARSSCNRAAASTIAQRAIEQGMRTLRMDGWNKVRAGQTTIEEVLRVTQTEEHLQALVGT